jgi:cyclic pyranopterin phosphate synthase
MPCGLIDHQPIPLVLAHHQKSIVPRYNSGDSDVRRPTHGVPLRFESEVVKIMPENQLTHIDETGSATMVSVAGKSPTERTAVAAGSVIMKPDTLEMIKEATHKKGDVLTVAKIAGIQAAKQCSHLIPLCHPINLASVDLAFSLDPEQAKVDITASCTVTDATGVEMEALTAVSVAALTIYDMCKAVDKHMQLTNIRLTKKTGGRSGDFEAP